jgi:hypothetical protein
MPWDEVAVRLEQFLVDIAPIVARNSRGNVFALLGTDVSGTFTRPQHIEFSLQDPSYFTVVCQCQLPLDEPVIARAMEVALTLNTALTRGAYVVKDNVWMHRCELFTMKDDVEFRHHLAETIRHTTTCYEIFQEALDDYLATYAQGSGGTEDWSRNGKPEAYQDPLLKELFDQSQDE